MATSGRTDLAAEAHRLWRTRTEALSAAEGIRARTETVCGFSVDCVEILDEAGVEALHMPAGRYYSLSLPAACLPRAPDFPPLVEALAALLRRCLPKTLRSVLIAALGNPDVTPDALGPLAAEHILVTRHLRGDALFRDFRTTALCRTGVLGTTGMESAMQISSLCAALRPDCVLVVDALAGSEPAGLCRSIQVSDAGIAPGSGVENDREAVDCALLGVPVVAVGAPTVADASSLSAQRELERFFVTPRYIDSSVRQLARLIGYGINAALHPGLTLADMELLLE